MCCLLWLNHVLPLQRLWSLDFWYHLSTRPGMCSLGTSGEQLKWVCFWPSMLSLSLFWPGPLGISQTPKTWFLSSPLGWYYHRSGSNTGEWTCKKKVSYLVLEGKDWGQGRAGESGRGLEPIALVFNATIQFFFSIHHNIG